MTTRRVFFYARLIAFSRILVGQRSLEIGFFFSCLVIEFNLMSYVDEDHANGLRMVSIFVLKVSTRFRPSSLMCKCLEREFL